MSAKKHTHGYYRFPALHGETIVFTSEDDLWHVDASGGVARRLTAGLAECSFPSISQDGKHIAFTGREEGQPEVYLMPIEGGQPKRLTYLGGSLTRVLGWKDGSIIFTSNARQGFLKFQELYRLSPEGGEPVSLGLGHGVSISFGPEGKSVIGRNTADAARWKRYRGGTAGEVWLDAEGKGNFTLFSNTLGVKGNFVSPIWISQKGGSKICFVSDHDGIGNLCSSKLDGSNLQRLTNHTDYYVRYPQKDSKGGSRIVYHAGSDIYIFDFETGKSSKVNIEYHSPRTQCNRKFVEADKYLENFGIHPESDTIVVTTRGKSFSMAFKEGPVSQFGIAHGVRYRLAQYLCDGEHLATISDASGEEAIEIYSSDNKLIKSFETYDIGRALTLSASPKKKQVALTNHRQEILMLDIDTGDITQIDKSDCNRIHSASWSADGRYIAYDFPTSHEACEIRVFDTVSGKSHTVTKPVLRDFQPCFDPEGKYIYFLGQRIFNPAYDTLHFDLNFPRATKAYLIPLRKDITSPFMLQPKKRKKSGEKDSKESSQPEKELEIDFDGIIGRAIEFPIPEGRYHLLGAAKNMILLSQFPFEGALTPGRSGVLSNGTLEVFKFEEKKHEKVSDKITWFSLSPDNSMLIYRSGSKLYYSQTSDLSESQKDPKEISLSRIKISLDPVQEWSQMYKEAWRLQRDQFWTSDMSGVDWKHIFKRYESLLARISTRSEFSDLMWEMQGELATSHCYEMGGDYRPEPKYLQGSLGADFEYDEAFDAYRITYIPKGDEWESGKGSPLLTPGVNVKEGDLILGVGNQPVNRQTSIGELLVNQAGSEILVTVADADKTNIRTVRTKTLQDEQMLRYRDWVNRNLEFVHEASGGKLGYVHVPNMGPWGYAEFFRYYLSEYSRQGLIVDVRYNGGGHVSQLLLEKLARKRLGYDVQRWAKTPEPYPAYSVLGPIVALTNEFAGSDGDIFSHSFKLMNLGKLVGKRTWGGVIGIFPRHSLADGTVTTQPEFSFWFFDVGWGVENYGTDPDISIDIAPQDFHRKDDPQLKRAIDEALSAIATEPPVIPSFGDRPNLALPSLSNSSK
ncbi:MAG: peptidase [Chlorobiales bacterium]|nr:peptidase [Chlorobiales bacterium]